MEKILLIFLFLIILFACEEKKPITCPPAYAPTSPYDDPLWHPSGDLIGFNHIPVKEMILYDDPCWPVYHTYELDSAGFWLINVDGTNQRRILPYTLQNPAWSPDGNWIAFVSGAQIFKMPFDGEEFDTLNIVQLTFEGRNFFPAWSPDGEWIAYDSNFDSPTGLNFIWKMKNTGLSKKRIAYTPNDGETRLPNWGNDFTIVHQRYVKIASPEIFRMDSAGKNVIRITTDENWDEYPKYTTNNNTVIAYISTSQLNGSQLLKMDIWTKNQIQLTNEGCTNFYWSPDGRRIVYLRFDWKQVDEKEGTLWIMESDGTNKQQLTHNHFKIIHN